MCWGRNVDGQVGDGTVTAGAKVDVVGLGSGVANVTAGDGNACAVLTGGGVKCWGYNEFGQVGDGTLLERATPVSVAGLAAGAIAAQAGRFSCALTSAGGVKCWGATGNFGAANSPTPIDVSGLASGVTAIAGSGDASHACALSSGGVKCFGSNGQGQLGNGGLGTAPQSPVDAIGLTSGVVSIAVGGSHSCAVTVAGAVRCWGSNRSGQLGDGTYADRSSPVAVAGLSTGAAAVTAGYRHTCALMTAGTVKCWGENNFFQVTTPRVSDTEPIPIDVMNVSGVVRLSAGGAHNCALSSNGDFKCWGENTYGQLGDGTTISTGEPRAVTDLTAVREVSAGRTFTCAVTTAGAVKCWGFNGTSQLGNDTINPYNVPVTVAGLASGVRSIDAGSNHTCAVTSAGGVKCWGGNFNGQRGDFPDTRPAGTPRDVAGIPGDIIQISVSDTTSCALASSGVVACWGLTYQLGFLSREVPGLQPLNIQVATGTGFGCALDSGGGVKCWGFNNYGRLGNGTTTSSVGGVDVTGLQGGVVAIAAGSDHACALLASGVVKCWGRNFGYALGDGTTVDRSVPGDVPGLPSDVAAITATCAHTRSGAVWCWGGAAATTPLPVPELQSGVVRVSASCVIVAGGGMACRGDNRFGQLGDGTLVLRRERPAAVVALDRRGFLDLTPDDPLTADKQPPFLALATGTGTSISATIQPRPQDIGTVAGTYVFALAPADIVRPVADGEPAFEVGKAVSKRDSKDTAVACVLAQLNASGQLQAVSASSLQAYVTGVLTGQGAAVTVINGTAAVNIAGATFYVGYGPNAGAMLNGGLNRSVVSVAGAKECKPQAPQTGWWWNAQEGGRGYSIEVQGNHIFYAAFLYAASGLSKWHVATGSTSLDGSLFTGDLLEVRNGQTLFGPYVAPNPITSVGPITLAFSDASNGTMVWPGGTVAIERFAIIPNGLTAPAQPGVPDSGWWWNPAESGRGFFIEWQNGAADLAGYMYDEAGNPVWYLSLYPTSNPLAFTGNWWTYANGQTLTGPYRPATQTSNTFAPVAIQFHSRETATLTLPGGRTTNLVRHRF